MLTFMDVPQESVDVLLDLDTGVHMIKMKQRYCSLDNRRHVARYTIWGCIFIQENHAHSHTVGAVVPPGQWCKTQTALPVNPIVSIACSASSTVLWPF